MKSFTYTQKKWAMTSCLLLALGFNLSVHYSGARTVSTDFASMAASTPFQSGSVELDGSKKTVFALRDSSDPMKTQVMLYDEDEGGICKTCVPEVLSLDTPFKNNLEGFDAIAAKLKETYKGRNTDQDEEVDDVDYVAPQRDSDTKRWLNVVKKACARYEGQDQLKHYVIELQRFYRAHSKVKMDEQEINAFYEENIHPLLSELLEENRTKAEAAYNVVNSSGDYNEVREARQASKEAALDRARTLHSLRNLLEEVPRKYESIRSSSKSSLLAVEVSLIKKEITSIIGAKQDAADYEQTANDLKSQHDQALRQNPQLAYEIAPQLYQANAEAKVAKSAVDAKKSDLSQLLKDLRVENGRAYKFLQRASDGKLANNSVMKKYMDRLQTYMNGVAQDIQKDNFNSQIQQNPSNRGGMNNRGTSTPGGGSIAGGVGGPNNNNQVGTNGAPLAAQAKLPTIFDINAGPNMDAVTPRYGNASRNMDAQTLNRDSDFNPNSSNAVTFGKTMPADNNELDAAMTAERNARANPPARRK